MSVVNRPFLFCKAKTELEDVSAYPPVYQSYKYKSVKSFEAAHSSHYFRRRQGYGVPVKEMRCLSLIYEHHYSIRGN